MSLSSLLPKKQVGSETRRVNQEKLVKKDMLQDKCYSNIENHEFYYLTAERKFWCNRSMSVVLLKCYLKELCTDQFHYIDLDSGWTLNNHLNAELFRSDNLHLNRKGYEKLSKLFIGKIESLQITVRRQNLKAPRNYTEAHFQ